MEIFLYVLIALAAIVLTLVAIIAMQPADFRVVRSVTIMAPPSEVFAQVNDLLKKKLA